MFFNPEKVPVKVYYSTDQDAPKLDRSANCVQTIFKACLVTGFGNKQGAGWTMPFEDTANGIKVFRPEVGAEQDFYLKMSADTGREVTAQVLLNMTAVDNGELKLQCETPFYYGKGQISGKWVLVASPRGVWFLCENMYEGNINRQGAFFTCGDTTKSVMGDRLVYLHHTGGTWADGSHYSPLTTYTAHGNVYLKSINENHVVNSQIPVSFFDGITKKTSDIFLSPLYLYDNEKIYAIPAVYATSTGSANDNFTVFQGKIIFGLGGYKNENNFAVDVENWVY